MLTHLSSLYFQQNQYIFTSAQGPVLCYIIYDGGERWSKFTKNHCCTNLNDGVVANREC